MTTCLTMDDNCDVLYTDITEAIYAAASSSSPAEVHLCPGLYKINKTIHIDTFNTTSFSIIGVQGANLTRLVGGPQLLRIDGDSQKLMMKCSISGITFVNGTAAAASDSSVEEGGGCLVLSGNLSVSVSSCWFNSCTAYVTNNTGGGGGGAVLMRNIPEADFTNCHFKANRVNIKNYRIVIAYYPNVVARIGGSAVHVTLSGGADDKKDHTFTSCTFVDNIALVTDPRIGKSSLFDPHVSQCKVGIGVSFTDTIFLAGGAVTIASTGVFHFHDTNFRNNSMLVGKPSMRMVSWIESIHILSSESNPQCLCTWQRRIQNLTEGFAPPHQRAPLAHLSCCAICARPWSEVLRKPPPHTHTPMPGSTSFLGE